MKQRQIIGGVLALATALAPLAALPETYGQDIARVCPNGSKIATMIRKIDEAVAMVDPSRFALWKQASLEIYRCSQASIDAYSRDIAKYFVGQYLYLSTKTNGQVMEVLPHVVYTMNELAASTKFADLRRMALKLKSDSNEAIAAAHDAVYGTPEPHPEASSQ